MVTENFEKINLSKIPIYEYIMEFLSMLGNFYNLDYNKNFRHFRKIDFFNYLPLNGLIVVKAEDL